MNSDPHNELLWDDLLTAIEDGDVIPVVGSSLLTIDTAEGRRPLYHWLAEHVAAGLDVTKGALPDSPSLHDVVCSYLLGGGGRQNVYKMVKQILDNCSFQPPPALLALARIRHFNLFLTPTFDGLLEDAINAERFQGDLRTMIVDYFPEAEKKDLPRRMADLGPTVYYLMGKYSRRPKYAVWDEDLIEFTLSLHESMTETPNLAIDLKEHDLLFLGMNFSDWLVRFFLRIARQERLSTTQNTTQILADEQRVFDQNLVMFFDTMRQNTRVVPCDPIEFVLELESRWQRRHGGGNATAIPAMAPFAWPAGHMPERAVFVSYAREDLDAVKRLVSDLSAAGCEVWFDVERMRAGENWENTLREEVQRRCSVFISIISPLTETEPGYYHVERNWAKNRSLKEGALGDFYLPVIIDSSIQREAIRREPLPDHFDTNVMTLPGGETTPEFCRRVRALQSASSPTVTL